MLTFASHMLVGFLLDTTHLLLGRKDNLKKTMSVIERLQIQYKSGGYSIKKTEPARAL